MKIKSLISILIMMISLLVMNAVITGAQENAPSLSLSPENIQVQPGQEFTVTINVADAAGVYGGSFKLVYDPQTLELLFPEDRAVTPGAFFDGQPSFVLKNSANVQEGAIEYALTLTQPAQPVSGSGVLGTITFRALSDAVVNIMPMEALFMQPEFTQVDGRTIAQKVNEVEAHVQGAAITVSQNAPATVSSVSERPASTTINPYDEPMIVLTKSDVLVLAAASLFFIAGLALFTMTIGFYSRMNVRPASRRSRQFV
jgi:hypothetical protein